MEAETQAAAATAAARLRRELKQWEHDFARAHAGRAATRDEIKALPDIAAKYKEYNAASGKVKAPKRHDEQHDSPKRKRAVHGGIVTPRKKSRRTEVEAEARSLVDELVENVEVTPTIQRTFIGPTPQKDGRVLGLFDALSPVPPSAGTPSRRVVMGIVDPNAAITTPSKRSGYAFDGENTPSFTGRHSRTPQSAGKRFMLDQFATPSKSHRAESRSDRVALGLTPESTTKITGMVTPAFLRRSNFVVAPSLDVLKEDDEDEENRQSMAAKSPSKTAARRRQFTDGKPGFRTGLSRSLSSMIAEMRRAEDARLDEELDLLHEIEEGGAAQAATTMQPTLAETRLLGPDGAAESDDEDNRDTSSISRRLWKKKGQKRQTRRVVLKPAPRLPRPREPHAVSGEADAEGTSRAVAAAGHSGDDTLVDVAGSISEPAGADHNPFSEQADGACADGGVADDGNAGTAAPGSPSESLKATAAPSQRAPLGGLVDKVRKAGAAAHANYCRLKIRSAKGAAGAKAKGRYGRRR